MITLALVVACIASYRALFLQARKTRRKNLEENPSQQHLRNDGLENAIHINRCAAEISVSNRHGEDV